MPELNQFRNALHGYNREDVVAYIDQITRQHADELRRLQEQNDSLRAQLNEANEALADARENEETEQALREAQALAAELKNRNEELEAQLDALQERLAQGEEAPAAETETVPAPISQDLSEPIPPVEEVLPAGLKPTKDYTELELAAYRRAELAERLAHERAAEVYRQVSSVFNQANIKLDNGKSDLEQLSKALTADVNELLTLLTHLHGSYRQAEESFAELGERNRSILEGEE